MALIAPERSAPRWKHDVFLSFRGEDTREGFVSYLYRELVYWRAVKTFKDDKDLHKGVDISPELLQAIEQSQLAIVVLSPNYASSSWCLDELVKIVECMGTRNAILPVFYNVDPSHVRKQRGIFAEAFAKHEENFIEKKQKKKVKRWRKALRTVGKLSGWHSKNFKYETELMDDLVQNVWRKVCPTFKLLDSREKLVGIDVAIQQLGLLLAPQAQDVRFIGIWGMGGVGKTTLAKLVFERIAHNFDVSDFFADVSSNSLVKLQQQLLSKILKKQDTEVWDVVNGSAMTRNCLFNKKVLLIVDNVDAVRQLEVLAGHKDWFGMGSRVIITSRNKHVLLKRGVESEHIYEVQGLCENQALQLFSQHAFKKNKPEEGFLELSKGFINHAKGLPLALKIIGSSLSNEGLDWWNCVLNKLKNTPNTEIFSSLKLSYDALDEMEKGIFLDIACFYKGKEERRVIELLDFCEFDSCVGIRTLVDKSLITIEKSNYPFPHKTVEMHDLIKEMACEIVRQESRTEPGQRSRLWLRNEIFHVLTNNTGTEQIECIVLSLPQLETSGSWNPEAFRKMYRLRILKIDGLIITVDPTFLPNSLRIFDWSRYPSTSLPQGFQPQYLAELNLPESKLVRLWEGTQYLPNLKYMDLGFSENLTSIPDLTGSPKLEKMDLQCCKNLVEIDPSIGCLKKLKYLDLTDCGSIKRLPSKLEMDSLEYFSLWGCSKVENIPEFAGNMKNLSQLILNRTAIENIPSSIECLHGLVELWICDCKSLVDLPSGICKLISLKKLYMSGCSKFNKLSESFGEMESLDRPDLEGSALNPPPSLVGLCHLDTLDLSDCYLCEGDIPDGIGRLSSLRKLDLSRNNFVTLPGTLKWLSKLWSVKLNGCKRLEQLPDLPSNGTLHVEADDCCSLTTLSEPSECSGSTNLSEFSFSSANCFKLSDDEGLNDTIFSLLRRLASQGVFRDFKSFQIISAGSKIPGWFNNQFLGDTINLTEDLYSARSNGLWIACCVVFAEIPEAREFDFFEVHCGKVSCALGKPGRLIGDHIWVFHMPFQHFLSSGDNHFQLNYYSDRTPDLNTTSYGRNNVKMCGYCWVEGMKTHKRMREYQSDLPTKKWPRNEGVLQALLRKRIKGRSFSEYPPRPPLLIKENSFSESPPTGDVPNHPHKEATCLVAQANA